MRCTDTPSRFDAGARPIACAPPRRSAAPAAAGLAATLAMVLGLALSLLPASAPAALAQSGAVRAQYGDWQLVCKKRAGTSREICALVQSVIAEDRPNVGLTVYFQKYTDGTRVLRVFAPLGVLLPTGLGLKIDNTDVGHAPFLRCHTFACYAQVVVDDGLIAKLKSGKTALFIIFQTEEAGIGIPVSLKGFKTGLAKLR